MSTESRELYNNAILSSFEREKYLSDKYNETDIKYIKYFMKYLENVYTGYGHHNNEIHFQKNRKKDATGNLFQEAFESFEYTKKQIKITENIRQENRKCFRVIMN
jgi:hypothetical protein